MKRGISTAFSCSKNDSKNILSKLISSNYLKPSKIIVDNVAINCLILNDKITIDIDRKQVNTFDFMEINPSELSRQLTLIEQGPSLLPPFSLPLISPFSFSSFFFFFFLFFFFFIFFIFLF